MRPIQLELENTHSRTAHTLRLLCLTDRPQTTNRKSACRVDLSENILLLLERVNFLAMLFNHFSIFKNTELKIHIYYLIISNKLCQSLGLFVTPVPVLLLSRYPNVYRI